MPIFEKWKVISDFPNYEVSNLGEVRNKSNQRVLSKALNKRTGYLQITLCSVGNYVPTVCYVHRLVAQEFVANTSNYKCVNHKDENKQNNHADNLEWVSYKRNSNYGTRNRRIAEDHLGKPHPHVHKRPVVAIDEQGKCYRFSSVKECADSLGIYPSTIYLILKGKMQQSKGFKIMEAIK